MRVQVDGQHFDVPDDATTEEIDAISKQSAAPAPEPPGLLRRAMSWATTPSPGMQKLQEQNRQIAGENPGVLRKDSPDWLAAAGQFVSGLPGAHTMPNEATGRLGRFSNESPKTSLFLRIMGGLGSPVPAAPAGAPAAGRLATALDEAGTSVGRRVLSGGANPLSVRAPVSAEAVNEAFRQGAFRPLGTTQKAADVLEAARETTGDQYARIVRALESKGVTGPEAQALAEQFAQEGAATGASTMNPAVPRIFETAAEQIANKPTSAGHLALSRSEDLKRSLQDQARSAYRQLAPNEVGQAHEKAASMLRQAVEDAIASQTANAAPDTAAIASQFVPIKQQLGRVIEASDAATKGAAQAARRAHFSLTDYLAAGAGASHGPIGAGASALLNKVVRTYGPSTAAWALKGGAQMLGKAPEVPDSVVRAAITLAPAGGKLDLDTILRLLTQKSSPATIAQADQQ